MTRLLTWLTLGLVTVIVAVLASHLILIAAALVRANRNLAKLVGGLEAIRTADALHPDRRLRRPRPSTGQHHQQA